MTALMQKIFKLIFVLALLTGSAFTVASEELVLPVPAVTIRPGDVITDSMLKEQRFPPNYRARYAIIEAPLAVIGKVARRTLLPGELIPANAVDDAKLVLRNVPTQIVFREKGLSITAVGAPLQSGSLGELIRLRNMDTGRIIHGVVQADGTVRVGSQ